MRKPKPKKQLRPLSLHPLSFDEAVSDIIREARVVDRLDRPAFVSTVAKAEAGFKINRVMERRLQAKNTVLGETAVKRIRELEPKPVFVEHGLTLYGRLYQLKDKSVEFLEDRTGFWGELRLDNGERWRIKFGPELEAKAATLFRKQVCVEGNAHYFQHRTPRVTALNIEPDLPRDLDKVLDELWGIDSDHLSNVPFEELLASRYGTE